MGKKGYSVVSYMSVTDTGAVAEYMKLAGKALEGLGGRVILGGKPGKVHEVGSLSLEPLANSQPPKSALPSCA